MHTFFKISIGFLLGVITIELLIIFIPDLNLGYKIQLEEQYSRVVVEENPEDPVFELRHDPNQALDVSMLYSLSFFKKNVLKESVLTSSFEGTVTNVAKENGIRSRNGIDYPYAFGFNLQNDGQESGFYFQEQDREKIQVYNASGQLTDFASLNDGDTIIMEYVVDMTANWDNNISKVTIKVL